MVLNSEFFANFIPPKIAPISLIYGSLFLIAWTTINKINQMAMYIKHCYTNMTGFVKRGLIRAIIYI